MKDYTNSQNWPTDERIHMLPIRGNPGWAKDPADLLNVSQLAQDDYQRLFEFRPETHHVSARGVDARRPGHNFGPEYLAVICHWPEDVIAFATVHDDKRVEWTGWATVATFYQYARQVFERGTLYFNGPFEPWSTFNPSAVIPPKIARVIPPQATKRKR